MKSLCVVMVLSLIAATAVSVAIVEVTVDQPAAVSRIDAASDAEGRDTTCCNHDGLRGECNGDDSGPNIPDLTYLVEYLFGGGPPPLCMIECDMNADGTLQDPIVNIADLTYLIRRMFDYGPPPEPCP